MISPRFPTKRRYASIDEINEYGRWAWEAKERPKIVTEPVNSLLIAYTNMNSIEPSKTASKVLENVGYDFAKFLVLGIPGDRSTNQISERKHQIGSKGNGVTPVRAFSRSKFYPCHKYFREIDTETNLAIAYLVRNTGKILARYAGTKLTKKYGMSELNKIAESVWKEYQIKNYEGDNVMLPNALDNLRKLFALFDAIQKSNISYTCDVMSIPNNKNMAREMPLDKIFRDYLIRNNLFE